MEQAKETLFSGMLPFLQLDIIITNNEDQSKVVAARIQPSEVEYYYPGFYQGTVIVTKTPASYLTTLTVEELDNALQAYYSAVQNNAGQFGVLKITPKPKLHATS